ncbi:restriction endonuclease subunit S [Actinobacillus minor]|nr:restriction endonuclease subunit S [Actinobacillus minor]
MGNGEIVGVNTMKEQKKCVPEIRFAGFTDDWEQRKLGEIAEIVMGQSPNSGNYTNNPKDHILVQGNADIKNGKVFPRIWTTQITKIGKKNDLIMSVRAPVGDMAKTDYDVVLGRGVCAIKGNEFIYQILSKMKIDGYWNALSTGSTFDAINSNDIKKTLISIPKEQKEQTAIGNFFKQLDDTIALHQRALEKYQKLKISYLEKMFPKENEQFPELRFPNFTDAWEQRKLGEVVDIFDGTHQTPKYTDKGVMFLSVEDIKTLSSNKFISEVDFKKEFKNFPRKGDVLMTRIGDVGTANVVLSDHKVAYYVSLALLKPKGIHSFFLATAISSSSVQSDIWKRTLHIAFPKKINKSEIEKIDIFLPSSEEQQKIGNFFKQLDDTIALHQREVEKYKKIKQAYLEKMFI